MKKGKNRSEVSLSHFEQGQEDEAQPLDILTVKIKNLRLMDELPKRFSVKVTYYDQLILNGVIMSTAPRAIVKEDTILSGSMSYDPSDYEKMSLMADHPLCVQIQPLKSVQSQRDSSLASPSSKAINTQTHHSPTSKTNQAQMQSPTPRTNQILMASPTSRTDHHKHSSSISESLVGGLHDISCCNIDILSFIIDETTVLVRKRMQPLINPPILHRKSWDNLPMLSMELEITRDKLNKHHHKILKEANFMTLTLVASYNMPVQYGEEFVYTAASKLPNLGTVMFNDGYRVPDQFDNMKFKPKWESLRVGDENFNDGDVSLELTVEDIQNDDNIPLERYMMNDIYTTVWGSFHRSLMLGNYDSAMWKHIRRYYWPLEVHIYGEQEGYSLMAFLNLFKLLYPGEDKVCLAVPLQWICSEAMQEICGCELLLTPNEKAYSTMATHRNTSTKSESALASSDVGSLVQGTGCDDNNAFIIVEVKLAHPLKKQVIPPHVPNSDIQEMLNEMEQAGVLKRKCSGRGQLDRDWQSTVRIAASALRKVPYYGMTEFCNFYRQLSETRTRVELMTSFCQDAAIYINNNFVVQDFLRSDDTFEEMVMMAHACLMITTCEMLVGVESWHNTDHTLRAARHARQLQDIPHAMELYLQLVGQRPRDHNYWRELSTCLKDVDRDWAEVCLNKAVVLYPRHPLSLLSKGCAIAEQDPEGAEPFFVALLAMYPFWTTAWFITSAYYIEREMFHMADQIVKYIKKTQAEGLAEDFRFPRTWEYELGDWWDTTPILPGMCPYFGAADLLLRLRAISLAEVCVARALCETGESAAYFHFVALCCRLDGNVDEALCHLRTGIDKFGDINYLRSLQAECYHKQKDIPAATAAFEKAGSCINPYSILLSTPCRDPLRARTVLVELARRQSSAYVWIALAEDWLARAATTEVAVEGATVGEVTAETCALVTAIQALKWDRRAGKAWALLARLVKPNARRQYCKEMAKACGYVLESEQELELRTDSKQSLCYHACKALRECRCMLCENMHI